MPARRSSLERPKNSCSYFLSSALSDLSRLSPYRSVTPSNRGKLGQRRQSSQTGAKRTFDSNQACRIFPLESLRAPLRAAP